MNSKKLYRSLGASAVLVGVGMILGHSLGQGTTNTPVWLGGILIVGAAVLFGMTLSSGDSKTKSNDE